MAGDNRFEQFLKRASSVEGMDEINLGKEEETLKQNLGD